LPSQNLTPLNGLIVDGRKGQGRRSFEQFIGVLEQRYRPFHCLYDLGHTDASVSVAIDHLKGFTVEFHAACRATEGDPQFLVESVQGYQVCAVVKKHLIETAGPEKVQRCFEFLR